MWIWNIIYYENGEKIGISTTIGAVKRWFWRALEIECRIDLRMSTRKAFEEKNNFR